MCACMYVTAIRGISVLAQFLHFPISNFFPEMIFSKTKMHFRILWLVVEERERKSVWDRERKREREKERERKREREREREKERERERKREREMHLLVFSFPSSKLKRILNSFIKRRRKKEGTQSSKCFVKFVVPKMFKCYRRNEVTRRRQFSQVELFRTVDRSSHVTYPDPVIGHTNRPV